MSFLSLKKDKMTKDSTNAAPLHQERMKLSLWSIICFLCSIGAAFVVGQVSRRYILDQLMKQHYHYSVANSISSRSLELDAANTNRGLPPPKVREDKEVPATVYTSKITDTAASSSAKTMILEKKKTATPTAKKPTSSKWQECILDENYEALGEECQVSKATSSKYKDNGDEEEDEDEDDKENESSTTKTNEEPLLHMPAGQHLLVDIKDVNHDFLNSEQRLSQAMVDVVWESDLTLLSYHCHELFPHGVSCVGVLLESHISFHTWPEAGVITLDLFTCGSGLLIPILPLIERLFAVPQEPATGEDTVEPPTMIWVHKLRGFRHEDDPLERHLGSSNLAYEILGVMDMDMKKQVMITRLHIELLLPCLPSFSFSYLLIPSHLRLLR
jgi:S-adenosylmethionine decarboxylase proenzyme